MEEKDYLKLYEVCLNEEHNHLEAHQTRVKFFSTLISGLFIALVAGIIKAEYWYHYAAL